ncbi:hypothetical protein OEZ85_011852 [Tetradesmus obliquus]|uniref:C3H1-type domain-containing protein n=1 Tax=Tetradesmus obliquus TaxID=3088 RepID=A0ABY8TRX3_TETOB|nr:hypothetical protein OEZ85_011852 [Tetradesmus obliquus]
MGSGPQRTGERYFGLHTKGTGKARISLSEEFLTYSLKVTPCNRKYPHDWASCLCGHKGERATRRDLRTHNYLPIACEYAKQRLECPRGDDCPHSHNLFEYWLHPKRFRTEMCLFRSNCDRRVCFFAHSSEELRQLQDGLPPAELCWRLQRGVLTA